MSMESFLTGPVTATYNTLVRYEQRAERRRCDYTAVQREELLLTVATKSLACYAAVYHSFHICIKALPAAIREVLRHMPIRTARHIGKAIPKFLCWSAVRWHARRVSQAIQLAIISNAFDRDSDKCSSDRFLTRVERLAPDALLRAPVCTVFSEVDVSCRQRSRASEIPAPNSSMPVQPPPKEIELKLPDLPKFKGTLKQQEIYEGVSERLGLWNLQYKPFVNPVVDANGHTAELTEMQRWISDRGETATTPLTGAKLAHHRLTPNLWARDVLQQLATAVLEGDDDEDDILERIELAKVYRYPVVVHQPIEGFQVGQTYEFDSIPVQYRHGSYIVTNHLAKSVTSALADIKAKATLSTPGIDDSEDTTDVSVSPLPVVPPSGLQPEQKLSDSRDPILENFLFGYETN